MNNGMLNFENLEAAIGFSFENKNLLKESLTHRSYLNENSAWPFSHNERLEYLGDAVLELVVSEALFKKFPKAPEGQMTVLRAALVNYQMLGAVAAGLHLDDFIFMSRGERADTSKAREVILANAIESLIGALYLDAGLEAVGRFAERFILTRLPEILETKSYRDSKSELQEIVQEKLKVTPTYGVLEESGPAHQRTFRIGVYFGEELIAEGAGASKQEAEVEAAKKALEKHK